METVTGHEQYYPPRARWYGWVLALGDSFKRQVALERLQLSSRISFWEALASVMIPGCGFYVRGPRLWGILVLTFCAALLLGFTIWLGYPLGNVFFGLLLSVHVTSLGYLFRPLLELMPLSRRLLFSVAALGALTLVLYLPARNFVQDHWLMPLRVNGRVMVVNRLAAMPSMQRGDWIAYPLANQHLGQNIYSHDGYGLGPILGLPGDRVRFTKVACEINGVPGPRAGHMPISGEFLVPEKHWFLWPDLDITIHGHVPEANISATLQKMGTISESQLIGRPFKRWFGRNQLPL